MRVGERAAEGGGGSALLTLFGVRIGAIRL